MVAVSWGLYLEYLASGGALRRKAIDCAVVAHRLHRHPFVWATGIWAGERDAQVVDVWWGVAL